MTAPPIGFSSAAQPAVGFTHEHDFAARQYKGRRENQEDYYAFADAADRGEQPLDRLLLVIGDGLGAHAGGSVASYLAVNAFVRAFHQQEGPPYKRLCDALDVANDTLRVVTERMPPVAPPMGTTLLSLLISPETLQWISVGDSPLFLFREGRLRRLNEDHSLVPLLEERVRHGSMTAEEAAHHPDRHTLQSALLGIPMALIDCPCDPLQLQSGDILIAASDGIFTLGHAPLEELLNFGKHTTAGKLADAILFAIRRINHDRQDNATIGVVKIA